MRWSLPRSRPHCKGVSAAYYLIHGLKGGKLNAERDLRSGAQLHRRGGRPGCAAPDLPGRAGGPDANLSPYLRSRHETGYILRQSRIPVTEFRAGMIVGSGSVLFEMIRYLTEREPVLICPAWFFSEAQPIAIRDVLDYLVAALKIPGKRRQAGRDRREHAADLCGHAAGLCKGARAASAG